MWEKLDGCSAVVELVPKTDANIVYVTNGDNDDRGGVDGPISKLGFLVAINS